jgi:hypothetical protein
MGHSHEAAERSAGDWRVDRLAPDRRQIEAQIRDRVRSWQLGATAGNLSPGSGSSALDPLVALGAVPRPRPVSARPGVSHVKRLLRRMLNWELDPIVRHIDALQRATIEAMSELESRRGSDTGRDAATGSPVTRRSSGGD